MYRQSPSRSQRSKGIKVKYVLRICLFLGVCFWLAYQVKRSNDKKKEFGESDVKASLTRGYSNIFKLGRKDIRSRVEEMTVEDEEENKREEDGLEDNTDKENVDGGMDGRDEMFDAEVDRENPSEDKRENGEGDENENEERDSENIIGQTEKESLAEETDVDGDDMTTHEAHEDHYKADDASSAVTHETRVALMENDIEHDEKSNEQIENFLERGFKDNTSEEAGEGEKRKELEVEVDDMAKDGPESNVANNETEENIGTEGLNHHSETSKFESEYVPEILTEDTSARLKPARY